MQKVIINIGRQLGSGGKKVGEMLAREFNIPIYDRTLIALAAKESGFGREFFEKSDEEKGNFGSLLGIRIPFIHESFYGSPCSDESLFKIQSDVIRHLAEQEESCIFVGRCADYILRDDPRCLNVFITADEEPRVTRIRERHPELSREQALQFMEKTDRKRAAYYNYYSGKTWGMASSYHLCLNSSLLGLEGTMQFIKSVVQKREE